MDSGNSGSIQSSSGGDDEYESRATHSPSFSNTNNINPALLFSQSSAMFDPLSNYFDPPISSRPQTHDPNSILNLDMVNNPFFTTQTPSFPQVSEAENNPVVQQEQDIINDCSQSRVGARNPKKRSRASRRAPTTVLTTDTSNFRAMVQEFTGIPAPPFTSSSPFPRTRLDLFRSQPSTFHQNHNLLRPLPHKIQPQVLPFTTNTSELCLLKQPESSNNIVNNMQMQKLTFQSFLQPADDQYRQINTSIPSPHLSNSGLVSSSSPRNYQDDGNGYTFTGADNVSASASRGDHQGLMESWICSSD